MKRRSYGHLLDFAKGAGVQRGRLLDIGCGLGYSVEEALARGYDAFGTESSAFALELISRRLPDRVFDHPPPGPYELVTLMDVLEHIADPLALLRELARQARWIVLTTPDLGSLSARIMGARWHHLIPEHVSYFDRHTLKHTLSLSGWRPKRVGAPRKSLRVDYVRGILSARNDVLGRMGAALLAPLPARLTLDVWSGDQTIVAQRATGS